MPNIARIRGVRWALALSALLVCACSTASILSTPSPITWVQVWSDEFDGAAGARIDDTKWSYQTADGCKEGICGWGNNEKEYYTDASENIALNGQGQLVIVARSAPAGLTCYYGPCRYTSGKVTTRGKMLAQPGRVEARIKLPAGQGLWPAFWMLGHAHDLASGALSDDFHTFAVEWDSLFVRFFVDNALHYEIARDAVERFGKSVLDQPYFVILNLAVGGHFDGDPQSDAIFPATMLVDYVRVYVRQ